MEMLALINAHQQISDLLLCLTPNALISFTSNAFSRTFFDPFVKKQCLPYYINDSAAYAAVAKLKFLVSSPLSLSANRIQSLICLLRSHDER